MTVITSPLENGLLYSWKEAPSPFLPVLLLNAIAGYDATNG
jgi:hypothetical protein